METLKGDLKGLKIAYSPNWGYAAVDPQVRHIVEQAVRVFEQDLGCIVEEAHPGWEDPADAFAAIIAMESDLVGMRAMADKLGNQMTPYLRDFLSKPWTAEEFTNANMIRKAVCNLKASAAFETAALWSDRLPPVLKCIHGDY
ncbi:MAG: hypothetical protein IGR76_11575 [Synechococcales cyanobacterium T60_A2020_003]|nr:hypothetical protein [Synechococcales cyanobacterium T60_A2020_003]